MRTLCAQRSEHAISRNLFGRCKYKYKPKYKNCRWWSSLPRRCYHVEGTADAARARVGFFRAVTWRTSRTRGQAARGYVRRRFRASVPRASFACTARCACDREYAFLASHGLLPATQPYQTIVVGDAGRAYAEKYLRGRKRVDTYPTTVVEFLAPAALVRNQSINQSIKLFERQSKPEDGCTSHGLGDKGGGGLGMFNASLASRAASWRIVLVKR